MENSTYQNVAFISYSHRDMAVAKWLQQRLEGFKLPSEAHNDIDAQGRYLRPVFRDQSDLNTGVLSDELKRHLQQSKFLILICSKHSAQSAWVSSEAKAFVEMGRLDRIIPIIIPDGAFGENALFPEFLRNYFAEYPDRELLGINYTNKDKERTLIRVASRMLDVSFDSLWKRHQRQQRLKIIFYSAAGLIAGICAYIFAIPIEITVGLDMQRSNLPTGETITLSINGAEYTDSINRPYFSGIKLPGYTRFKDIEIKVYSPFYERIDTLVYTGLGVIRDINIPMIRDNSFGTYAGEILDENLSPLSGVKVRVNHLESTTDSLGRFEINIPLPQQTEELPLFVESKDLTYNYNGELHAPGRDIKLIMHRRPN